MALDANGLNPLGMLGTPTTVDYTGVSVRSNNWANPQPPQGTSWRNRTTKQQVFKVVCTGMKPNTVHKFHYEGVDKTNACIPVYPKPPGNSPIGIGHPLKTDATGKIEFNFYFTTDVERQVDIINRTRYELAGNKKFELLAADSSASKIVPFTK